MTSEEMRTAREAAGLTRNELGDRTNVGSLTIRLIETGRLRDERAEAKIQAALNGRIPGERQP